jgi:dUTP pyrophosphatase
MELVLSNSVGVIDAGYRGELQATFNKRSGFNSKAYNVGDKVCQIIILPHPIIQLVEADELSDSERSSGGFGSTGK